VSDVGTYYQCRGEIHGRYLFGTKLAADGSTNQFFRTDASGQNELTVDVVDVIPGSTNTKIESFAMNSDDDLLYFGHPDTKVLSTMDFELTNYDGTTFNLVLNTDRNASIEYSDGWLYWGNKYPFSAINDAFNFGIWRIFVQPEADPIMQRLNKNHNIFASDVVDQNIMFVDRAQNRMILSGSSMQYLQFSTDQNFAAPGMSVGFRTATSLNLNWTEVAGATGYTLFQDGVAIDVNTTSTSKHVTGLTDGDHYRFTLQYNTAADTGSRSYYQTLSAAPTSTDRYFPRIPKLVANGEELTSMCGFVKQDELLFNQGDNVYNHNLAKSTTELLGDIPTGTHGHQQCLLATGEVWHISGDKIYNAGVNLSNRINSTSQNQYLDTSAYVVMDISSSKLRTSNNTVVALNATNLTANENVTIQSFTVTLDTKTIYFTTGSTLWKYDIATESTKSMYTANESEPYLLQSLSLDPHNQNSMIFLERERTITTTGNHQFIIQHINLNLINNNVTEIKRIPRIYALTAIVELYNSMVYGSMGGYFYTIDITSTTFPRILESRFVKPNGNFLAMTLDTFNKRVILVEKKGVKVYPMPTMVALPLPVVSGCIDTTAVVSGCIDTTAVNYNRDATLNDLSCYGCNTASVNNGSCPFFFSGCMNETALNYRPQASVRDDTTCTFEGVSNRPSPNDPQDPVWVNVGVAVSVAFYLVGTLMLGNVVLKNLNKQPLTTTNTNKLPIIEAPGKSMAAGNISL
jgi:hypothetical protein